MMFFFSVMTAAGDDVCAPCVATEINQTRLWVVITRHVRFQRKNLHAECKASSNYGKVVKALALLLGICTWYPSEKQQAVGNLRPPLPVRLKPVRRAGLTNCLRNTDVSLNYSQNHL